MRKSFLYIAVIFLAGFALQAQKDTKALDEFVNSKEFRIESTWARPQATSATNAIAGSNLQAPGSSGNRINLIGNFNYFEMKGDSVSAYLPYYGERQFGNGHYSGDTAIEIKTIPRELVVEKNEKKGYYTISFMADQGTETFQVNLKLFPNLKSLMTINSNQRFVINYEGKLMALKEEEPSK
ncbi:MAG: DUF4251 domain-containing protein [Flavobacteriaceae bacterium]